MALALPAANAPPSSVASTTGRLGSPATAIAASVVPNSNTVTCGFISPMYALAVARTDDARALVTFCMPQNLSSIVRESVCPARRVRARRHRARAGWRLIQPLSLPEPESNHHHRHAGDDDRPGDAHDGPSDMLVLQNGDGAWRTRQRRVVGIDDSGREHKDAIENVTGQPSQDEVGGPSGVAEARPAWTPGKNL